MKTVSEDALNVVDSSAWLEYFAGGPNAEHFADAIENTSALVVPSITLLEVFKEPLNNSARARRRLCGRLRIGLGERGLVVPNKRVQTRQSARKGPSRKGFAGKAASRALRPSAVAMATVTRFAPHDLRLFRLKRAPRRVVQGLL